MTSPFLTDEEVQFLCRPLRQPAAQYRYLCKLGYRVQRRPDGTPVVWRELPEPQKSDGIRWSR